MGLSLEIAGLTVTGDSGRSILTVDRLAIAPGEAVGVRGPSGAGKSTLLYALAGLAPIAAGSVRWGATDLAAIGEDGRTRFRRQSIGMIFQDFLLFEELSAAGNASLPGAYNPGAARSGIARRAAEMLAKLGLATGSHRTVASFSGGERQRVAVARALANDPAIILADEPTASLDRETGDRLIDDLVRLAREQSKSLIAVSHDPAVHSRMGRVLEIVDGRLVRESAPPVAA